MRYVEKYSSRLNKKRLFKITKRNMDTVRITYRNTDRRSEFEEDLAREIDCLFVNMWA